MWLYTNNESIEKKLQIKKIPLMKISKQCKFMGININKVLKDLHNKNYRPLKKRIKEDTTKSKDMPCSSMLKIKMAMSTKATYTFNSIPIKTLLW